MHKYTPIYKHYILTATFLGLHNWAGSFQGNIQILHHHHHHLDIITNIITMIDIIINITSHGLSAR